MVVELLMIIETLRIPRRASRGIGRRFSEVSSIFEPRDNTNILQACKVRIDLSETKHI